MASEARISSALPDHPKTLKLQSRLGDAGFAALIKLFLWTAHNRSDGNLTAMSDEDVEIAARWRGSHGAFVAALRDVRFLDGEPGNYSIHDWPEHNAFAAKRGERRELAKRAADKRWSSTRMPSASGADASRMRDAE